MKNSRLSPPGHLSGAAAGWWAKINGEWDLDDAGLLILQQALESFDRMNEARALVNARGILVKDRFQQDKLNPAVLVERDSRAAMLTAFKQLHLDIEPLHDRPGRPPGR